MKHVWIMFLLLAAPVFARAPSPTRSVTEDGTNFINGALKMFSDPVISSNAVTKHWFDTHSSGTNGTGVSQLTNLTDTIISGTNDLGGQIPAWSNGSRIARNYLPAEIGLATNGGFITSFRSATQGLAWVASAGDFVQVGQTITIPITFLNVTYSNVLYITVNNVTNITDGTNTTIYVDSTNYVYSTYTTQNVLTVVNQSLVVSNGDFFSRHMTDTNGFLGFSILPTVNGVPLCTNCVGTSSGGDVTNGQAAVNFGTVTLNGGGSFLTTAASSTLSNYLAGLSGGGNANIADINATNALIRLGSQAVTNGLLTITSASGTYFTISASTTLSNFFAAAIGGKAATNNTVTVNGDTQKLGDNPSFTVTTGGSLSSLTPSNGVLSADLDGGGTNFVLYLDNDFLAGFTNGLGGSSITTQIVNDLTDSNIATRAFMSGSDISNSFAKASAFQSATQRVSNVEAQTNTWNGKISSITLTNDASQNAGTVVGAGAGTVFGIGTKVSGSTVVTNETDPVFNAWLIANGSSLRLRLAPGAALCFGSTSNAIIAGIPPTTGYGIPLDTLLFDPTTPQVAPWQVIPDTYTGGAVNVSFQWTEPVAGVKTNVWELWTAQSVSNAASPTAWTVGLVITQAVNTTATNRTDWTGSFTPSWTNGTHQTAWIALFRNSTNGFDIAGSTSTVYGVSIWQ